MLAGLVSWGGSAVSETLCGSEWVPVEIEGVPASEATRAFVRFGGDGRLSGKSGCNRFTGSYRIEGGTLRIGSRVAMTRMTCSPAVLEEEARLVRALEAARGFSRNGIALEMTGEDGSIELRMRQTDWD
jgi:putative lipoprotein